MMPLNPGLIDMLIGLYLIALFVSPTEMVRDLLTFGWMAGVIAFLTGGPVVMQAAIKFAVIMVPVAGVLALMAVADTPLPGDRLWAGVTTRTQDNNAETELNESNENNAEAGNEEDHGVTAPRLEPPGHEPVPQAQHPNQPWPAEDLFYDPFQDRDQ